MKVSDLFPEEKKYDKLAVGMFVRHVRKGCEWDGRICRLCIVGAECSNKVTLYDFTTNRTWSDEGHRVQDRTNISRVEAFVIMVKLEDWEIITPQEAGKYLMELKS